MKLMILMAAVNVSSCVEKYEPLLRLTILPLASRYLVKSKLLLLALTIVITSSCIALMCIIVSDVNNSISIT
jgi:hypothetical protein